MRRLAAAVIVALVSATALALPHDYAIRAVPMTAVKIDDGFRAPKLEINRTVTIPLVLKENDDTGRVANFEKSARRKSGPYEGRRFNDTDVFKIIDLVIPRAVPLRSHFRANLLNGVEVITGQWNGNRPFVAIRYYAWNNRGEGEMAVWIKEKPQEQP